MCNQGFCRTSIVTSPKNCFLSIHAIFNKQTHLEQPTYTKIYKLFLFNVFVLFRNYIPLDKGDPRMLCAKFG